MPSGPSRSDKQEFELFCVRFLKALWKEFPDGEIAPVDQDPPVVEIRTAGGTIALEVSRLFQEEGAGTMQALESAQDKIAEKACAFYEAMGHPCVYVTIFFSLGSSLDITGGRGDQIAQRIADLVVSHLPGPGAWVELNDDIGTDPHFPPEIDSISVVRSEVLTTSQFAVSRVGWQQSDYAHVIQRRINQKERQLLRYRPDYLSAWLLLAAHGDAPSSFLSASDATVTHTYHSVFDRVFLLEIVNRRVFCLNKGC
jgi:hypothetical protein